jgi:hypothetical protein
LFISF